MLGEPITDLLQQAADREKQEQLLRAVEPHLRNIAAAKIHALRAGAVEGISDAVQDAYLNMKNAIESGQGKFESRGAFYAYAATVMRNSLIAKLKRRAAESLEDENFSLTAAPGETLLAITIELERLRGQYPTHVAAFDLKYTQGYTVEEIKDLLEYNSIATVKSHLALIRARLAEALGGTAHR